MVGQTEKAIYDNMKKWVTENDIKYCIYDIVTGEIVTTDDFETMKRHLYIRAIHDNFDNIRCHGNTITEIVELENFVDFCKVLRLDRNSEIYQQKNVNCELCNCVIKVSKFEADDCWFCNDCIDVIAE